MSGRQKFSIECAAAECRQRAFYDGLTVKEQTEMARSQQRRPWLCSRHREPDEVLSVDNDTRTTVAVATRLIDGSEQLFWVREGEASGSGFEHGNGFKAWANDFPEGARLVVTAHIETTTPQPARTPRPAAQTAEKER